MSDSHTLTWPELIPGKLIKRYKRFMADVELADGSTVTAHCPNSGKMTGCCQPGQPVYLSFHDSPRRRLKYTWEIIQMPSSLVGVNTQIPNRLTAMSVENGLIPELSGYDRVGREVKAGINSRIDLCLTGAGRPECFVEVKNCTLVRGRTAAFPDAVTTRGQKHLQELQNLIASGCRCVMFYVIQRMDADVFTPADDIDPVYGVKLRQALKAGVDILVYDVKMDLKGLSLNQRIPAWL